MQDLAGRTLGHYRIVEEIGRGGMGVVYRARDDRLRRDVAIKVLPEDVGDNPARLSRFEREARAAAALNHPNILAVYDVGEYEGNPYLVTELLEGATLRKTLQAGPLSVETALPIARQIAEGLAAAHGRGIVHRDLKPGNLFIIPDGRVKILDFGLAKLHGQTSAGADETITESVETTPEATMGTVAYMSPEQVRGEPADARSDIFSLGVVLYEMLTGERPFQAETSAEIMAAILRDDPRPLRSADPEIPAEIATVVTRCLQKWPEDRFSSALELLAGLDDTKHIEPGITALPSLPRLAALPPLREIRWDRNRVLPTLMGLGLAITMVTAAMMFAFDVAKVRSRLIGGAAPAAPLIASLAVLPLENLSRNPEQEYFADGLTETLISTLGTVSSLRVTSRHSAMRFKGSAEPLQEIARSLGVAAVVEGSVLMVGDRVRVTVRLIDPGSDHQMWTGSYDRPLEDVLRLQSELARSVVDELPIELTVEDQRRLDATRPVDPEAYRLYLQGRSLWGRMTPKDLQSSLEIFQRALDRDPDFAALHTGMLDLYMIMSQVGMITRDEFKERAEEIADRLTIIGAERPETYAALGINHMLDWDFSSADQAFHRAVELNPSYSFAWVFLAQNLNVVGRHDEALEAVLRARTVDPLNTWVTENVVWRYWYLRRFEEALAESNALEDLNRDKPLHYWLRGRVLSELGRHEEAIATLERAAALEWPVDRELAMILARAGRREEALEITKAAVVRGDCLDSAYLELGDVDAFFACLEQKIAKDHYQLKFLLRSPDCDPVRDDPRLAELERRLNLPPLR